MNIPQAVNSFRTGPDERGHFGLYGGRFVAETLMPLILDLEKAYAQARNDPAFRQEMDYPHAASEYRIALGEDPKDMGTELAYADVLARMKKYPEALKSYRSSLEIREGEASAYPDNVQVQRDVVTSHDKISNVLIAQNDLVGAIKARRESVAIAKQIAVSNQPGDLGEEQLGALDPGDGLAHLGGGLAPGEARGRLVRRHDVCGDRLGGSEVASGNGVAQRKLRPGAHPGVDRPEA